MAAKNLVRRGERTLKAFPALASTLDTIDVRGSSIRDLAPLAKLRRLRSLNLRGTPVASLEAILGVSSLQFLWAEKTKLTDLVGIGRLARLKLLWLHDTRVTDLDPVGELPALEELDVARVRAKRWSFLSRLPSLRVLDLYRTSFGDGDVARLAELPALEWVRLAKTKVNRKKCAAELRALSDRLVARGGGVSFVDAAHWRLDVFAKERVPPTKRAPKVKGVKRTYLAWSAFFFEVFVGDGGVLVREGRTFAAATAKTKTLRFATRSLAEAHAEKLLKDAKKPKKLRGSAVRRYAPARAAVPAPDVSAIA